MLAQKVTAIEGQEAVLPCLITDPALRSHVSLVRAGGKLVPRRITYSFSPGQGFIIHKVKFIDSYDYQCKAMVDGKASLSIGIRLEVEKGM